MHIKAALRDYYESKAQRLDEIGLTYRNPSLYKRFFYQTRFRAVLGALDAVEPRQRVLDVGGGPGYYAGAIAAAGGRVVLTDLSRGNLIRARAEASPRANLVCCDAAALPFAGDAFDQVLFTEVLEHLPDGTAAITEIRRALCSHGCAVITTPSRWSPMNLAYALKRRIRRYAFDEHVREYSVGAFKRLLSRCFAIESFRFANYLVPYPLDNLFLNTRSARVVQFLKSVEAGLSSAPLLKSLGWTMIAKCRKN